MAILCDRCIEEKREPKYAVEWSDDFPRVTYHEVEKLKDLPEISRVVFLEAEARLYNFGWENKHL